MDLTALPRSRIQFAFTVSFHMLEITDAIERLLAHSV